MSNESEISSRPYVWIRVVTSIFTDGAACQYISATNSQDRLYGMYDVMLSHKLQCQDEKASSNLQPEDFMTRTVAFLCADGSTDSLSLEQITQELKERV